MTTSPPRDADLRDELKRVQHEITNAPDSTELLLRAGDLYERTGDTERAAIAFARYIRLAPSAQDRAAVTERFARLPTSPTSIGKHCACSIIGSNKHTCRTLGPPRCVCDGLARQGQLCPRAWKPDFEHDPDPCDFNVVGVQPGNTCSGYDSANRKVTGAIYCEFCTSDTQEYRGELGRECHGFDPSDGMPAVGVLLGCT